VTTSTKERLLHRLETIIFKFYVIYCFMIVDSMDFGQNVLFGYMSIILKYFQVYELKFSKENMF
jgi:hypothetical protein